MPADHLASEILDDSSFATSSLLPPCDVTEASALAAVASAGVRPVAAAPVPATTSANQAPAPQRSMADSSQTHTPPPPVRRPEPQQQQNASAVAVPPPGEDTLCVSEQCTATKCFRLQWEAESEQRIMI